MNYCEGINFITSQGRFRVELGLERISMALNLLGNPQENLKCIHVAGTNGKGSICAIVSAILKEYGLKVGLYTSPHIFEYTERIKINEKEISEEDFAKYITLIKEKAPNIELTEFEYLTILMFKYFADNNVEIAVLETGLGGRLDATNVIKTNICALITKIDFDHTERLGNTIEKIAFEKAGIIKENSHVMTFEDIKPIKEAAKLKHATYTIVPPFSDTKNLSLKGKHQQMNLSLAKGCINKFFPEIGEKIIQEGLKKVNLPCRFQYIKEQNLIIDGSHNPNCIQALRENLDLYFPNEKRCFIFGCLRHKDYKKMMEILFREGDEIYLNEFNYPEACSYEELSANCPYKSEKYTPEINLPPDKLNIICGSFYMISKMNIL